jgi:5-(carboxyamino)imidazole ribonucleotide synthase
VQNHFPVVGVVGAGALARLLIAPATALGVDLLLYAQSSHDAAAQITNHILGDVGDLDAVKAFARRCTVITLGRLIPLTVIRALEADGILVRPSSAALALSSNINQNSHHVGTGGGTTIAVTVARSPHGQASAWTPTLIVKRDEICFLTQTPVPDISPRLAIEAQRLALNQAVDIGLQGVMTVKIVIQGPELFVSGVSIGPHESGHWTIDGSRTSQFEQHLRAILDLPLGDPSMTSGFAVAGSVLSSSNLNMYRPYLHLMARSPALKFHQYRQDVGPGSRSGHVTAVGEDLLDLQESVAHAVDYMSGVIDE